MNGMKHAIALLALLGCAPSSPPCPPRSAPVTSAPAGETPATDEPALESAHRVGDRVWIAFGQSWYPGKVVAVLQPSVYEVAYDGYSTDWNRVARPGQLRPFDSPPTTEGPPTAPSFQPDPGLPVEDITQLHAGMQVLILWNDTLWPGTVVRFEGDQVHVHYDGYAESWDETVPIERLSIPRQ